MPVITLEQRVNENLHTICPEQELHEFLTTSGEIGTSSLFVCHVSLRQSKLVHGSWLICLATEWVGPDLATRAHEAHRGATSLAFLQKHYLQKVQDMDQ